MTNPALDLIFKFFVAQPDYLQGVRSVLFLRAELHPGLKLFAEKNLVCQQTLFAKYQQLKNSSYTVCETLPKSADLVLYLGTKSKNENLWNFARALELLNSGGYFFCAMPNELGASRFEKQLKSIGLNIISWSKNHCRIFGARKDDLDKQIIKVANLLNFL